MFTLEKRKLRIDFITHFIAPRAHYEEEMDTLLSSPKKSGSQKIELSGIEEFSELPGN